MQIWEASTGRQVVIYRGHSDNVCSVAWSPDGTYIASASFDVSVQIWEAATGRHVYTYTGNGSSVYTVAWSLDGQRIASGDSSGTVKVWPVALFESDTPSSPQPTITYFQNNSAGGGQNNAVQAVAWSSDGRYIASGGIQGTVQVWNAWL